MIIFTQLGHLGQLGNQLFQVAATISHAYRMRVGAAFNKFEYNKWLLKPVNDTLEYMAPWAEDREHPIVPHTQFDYKPIPEGHYQMLTGFFQSEKYFNEPSVISQLTPGNQLMGLVREAGKNVIHHANVCAVHVRRTDYLEKQDYHPALEPGYYREAMNTVLEKHPGTVFFFFSDDIAWCRQNFGDKHYYSEHNIDIVDLYLMAQCRHHIIANSSFSWWGAWLRRMFSKDQQTVIAPKVWAGSRWHDEQPNSTFQDIYCKNWIIL